MFKNNLTYDPHRDRLALRQRKENTMAIFEFSDGFDAQGWYMEQMRKGHFDEDQDFDYERE